MGKVAIWLGAIFAPLGLIFAAVAGWFYLDDRSRFENGAHARGTVVELAMSSDSDGYSYRPVVEFRDPGGTRHVFASSVGSNPPSYSVGETVEVIYPPQAPGEATIDSFFDRYLLPVIFAAVGIPFAAVGLGLLYAWVRRRRIVARLRSSGLPLQARFVECYRDTRLEVNGRNPWRVVCQASHPATGQLHSFKSDPVWVDPSAQLSGRDVRVFVDPARPRHYWVDLSPFVDERAMG